jgi:hypothetical protein
LNKFWRGFLNLLRHLSLLKQIDNYIQQNIKDGDVNLSAVCVVGLCSLTIYNQHSSGSSRFIESWSHRVRTWYPVSLKECTPILQVLSSWFLIPHWPRCSFLAFTCPLVKILV